MKSLYSLLILISFLAVSSPTIAEPTTNPIKIGVITSLNPLVEPWSQSANIGLEKAADEINSSGGIGGKKLQLIFEDDQFLAKNAITAYKKLRNIDKVDFIIGPQFDQTVAPIRHLVNRDKQLVIQTIGTNPVNTVDYGYLFHACPSDKFAGEALAKRIMRDGHKKISFLIPEESYSQNLANFVKENLTGVNYQWINYKEDTTDYKPILLKAKSSRATALVFFFLSPDVAADIYRKMRQLDIHLPVYTSETLHAHSQFFKEAGDIAEPTIYYILNFDIEAPKIKNFLDSLDRQPTIPIYSVIAYDTLNWLSILIQKYGVDNTKIREALYRSKYKGLLTTYKFDKQGDHVDANYVAWQVTKDGYVRGSSL